ncbi:unnamed protein product [Closterium sp. NIES-54]
MPCRSAGDCRDRARTHPARCRRLRANHHPMPSFSLNPPPFPLASPLLPPTSTDAPWQRLWGALLNAAAMVALVIAATFVLVGLFYCDPSPALPCSPLTQNVTPRSPLLSRSPPLLVPSPPPTTPSTSTDAPWQRLWGALLNAAAMVALVTAATFVLVGLFYCGCARCIWGYMGFSGFVIFAGLGGTLAVQLIQVRLHGDGLVGGVVLVGLFYCGCARCIWGYMDFSGFVMFARLGDTLAVQLIQSSSATCPSSSPTPTSLPSVLLSSPSASFTHTSAFPPLSPHPSPSPPIPPIPSVPLSHPRPFLPPQRFSIPIDIITFSLLLYNLSVVGVLAVFFCRMPIFLTQSYLVAVGAIVAFWFSSLPEWTTWMVLIAMSLYDLYAVLTPGTCISREPSNRTPQVYEDIPALIYEAGVVHPSTLPLLFPPIPSPPPHPSVGPLKLLLDIVMERDEDIPALILITFSSLFHLASPLPFPPLMHSHTPVLRLGPLKLLLDIAMERDEDIPALIYEARPPPMPFAAPPPLCPPPRLLTPTRPLPSGQSLLSGPSLPPPPHSHSTMPTRPGHPPLSSLSTSSSSSSFPPSLSPSTASNPSPSGTTFRPANSTAGAGSTLVPNTALGQADGGGGSGGDGMTGGAVGSSAGGSRRTRVRGQFERRLQQQGSGAIGAASGGGGGRTFAGQLSAFVASAAAAAATSALRLTGAPREDERLGGDRGEGRRGRGVEDEAGAAQGAAEGGGEGRAGEQVALGLGEWVERSPCRLPSRVGWWKGEGGGEEGWWGEWGGVGRRKQWRLWFE